MARLILVTAFALALGFVFTGCSDDSVTSPALDTGVNTGVIRGDIAASGGFEFTSNMAGDPNHPVKGPFVIRGSNIRYDDGLGALLVDLTVINRGNESHPEPVSLTFINLLPQDVMVKNSDNGEMGRGAAIDFDFENDDAMWTPGEESLPRTVEFGVGPGTSIGFVARLDVGMASTGGSIGGMVWEDTNENGEMDSEEAGLGGVKILLFAGEDSDPATDDADYMTMTADDGSYRFDGLQAGFYTVMKAESPYLRPTTDTMYQIILVEQDGEVVDMMMVNFGCIVLDEPMDDTIDVGDFVEVTGDYHDDPHRIVARGIDVAHCDDDDGGDGDGNGDMSDGRDDDMDDWDDDMDDWDDDDVSCDGKSELRGPVTDIDTENHALAVMGTWVHFGDAMSDGSATDDPNGDEDHHGDHGGELDFDDVEIGQRVRVRVMPAPNVDDDLIATRLRKWNGTPEKVHGLVQEVMLDGDDRVIGLKVLNTMVEIMSKPRD